MLELSWEQSSIIHLVVEKDSGRKGWSVFHQMLNSMVAKSNPEILVNSDWIWKRVLGEEKKRQKEVATFKHHNLLIFLEQNISFRKA